MIGLDEEQRTDLIASVIAWVILIGIAASITILTCLIIFVAVAERLND